ncbi:TPA: hypothetical protein ACK3Q6_004290 [Burkholderia cepacia]|uniref:hypothetical protein n=1 Tax=Burkholderia cepacia TaxID=292 RepID=UPI000AE7BD2F|nr:hypothetical protein [Burkholderia cepacia]MCA8218605.1 hypothetical protein [Burkholderia cepacia]MCA8362769.1 hypothetical protein [Burkholderia cepacia]MCA8469835.1 hypothetical protein [Burkholderia cepacia]MDN7766270.1 hypothetical protein [Burkholderia cepacia]NTX18595.1 hypothetical protein [Burkholderia cepacia]
MSTGIVTFDCGAWSTRHPPPATTTNAALAQLYFAEAQLYCDNSRSRHDSTIDQNKVVTVCEGKMSRRRSSLTKKCKTLGNS